MSLVIFEAIQKNAQKNVKMATINQSIMYLEFIKCANKNTKLNFHSTKKGSNIRQSKLEAAK